MQSEKLRSFLIDIEKLLNVDLFTVTRYRKVYEPRIMVISFIRIELGLTFTVIGEAFEKDHSTIIYNVETWHDLCETDKYFKQRSDRIFASLREFFKGKSIIEAKEDPNEKVKDLRKIVERVRELQKNKESELMLVGYLRNYEFASISIIARALVITSGAVSRKAQKHNRLLNESSEYVQKFNDFCEMVAVKVVQITKIESWLLNAGTL